MSTPIIESNLESAKRDIGTEDQKIEEFVDNLRKDKYLIPTFQRDFVWKPENIAKLWDSIYRFYPIGSILYWETSSYLHTHRKMGGFVFPHDEDTVRKFKEWDYILDGQQRATSLLVSLLGGKDKVKDSDFDYIIYFDATDESFFFADELEKRKSKANPAFLIRLRDVPNWPFTFYKDISSQKGFTQKIENNLTKLKGIFDRYRISLIHIKGVEVNEVVQIFERINQEGKKLDPVDIVVARTYRNENPAIQDSGFYLRDYLKKLKKTVMDKATGSRLHEIDDYAIIQMVSVCLRKMEKSGRKSYGITPSALDNLTDKVLEANWGSAESTILEILKLLTDMKIHGPDLIPYMYLVFPLCYYLHGNKSPDLSLAKQWFWRTAFGVEDFRRADQVYSYCENFFDSIEMGSHPKIEPLTLSKSRLVSASYNYRSALSRAVLAFLAYQKPLDFSDPDAEVLDNVYLSMSQAPNLHHIYPQNFLGGFAQFKDNEIIDSLMNIAYLRAKTNIKVGDKNPLTYFEEFKVKNGSRFDYIMRSHIIPKEYLEKESFEPNDYNGFLAARAQLFCEKLKSSLHDVDVKIVE